MDTKHCAVDGWVDAIPVPGPRDTVTFDLVVRPADIDGVGLDPFAIRRNLHRQLRLLRQRFDELCDAKAILLAHGDHEGRRETGIETGKQGQ